MSHKESKNQGLIELLSFDEQANQWMRALNRILNQEIETVVRTLVRMMESHIKMRIQHMRFHFIMDRCLGLKQRNEL